MKNKIIILSLILLSIFYDAFAAQPKRIESEASIQNAVLVYINEYRRHEGLSKFKMDSTIVAQARQHSQDMASHRMTFGHQYFEKRIRILHKQIKNSSAGAENIAYNYKDAREVVRQWILSPGHKRNIEGDYNLTGIGVARDKQGRLYYTQIFLKTKDNPHRARTFFKF